MRGIAIARCNLSITLLLWKNHRSAQRSTPSAFPGGVCNLSTDGGRGHVYPKSRHTGACYSTIQHRQVLCCKCCCGTYTSVRAAITYSCAFISRKYLFNSGRFSNTPKTTSRLCPLCSVTQRISGGNLSS